MHPIMVQERCPNFLGWAYHRGFFTWWPVTFAVLALRSHSRPHQVPTSQRERMLTRPNGSYNAKTGRKRSSSRNQVKKSRQFFLMSPTNPKRSTPQRRSPEAGRLRFQLKNCTSERQLLDLLQASAKAGHADISVFSAAVQSCGQKRWWNALTDVLSLQKKKEIASDSVHISSVLHALSICLRRDGAFEVVRSRADVALRLGRGLIDEAKAKVQNTKDFNIMLSSAFKLCAAAGLNTGHHWALELWEWSSSIDFIKDGPTHSTFLALSERLRHSRLVDRMLQEGRMEGAAWAKDVVLLGGLLNASADCCDAARADAIWNGFRSADVQPNMICYAAYAKAHMLSGTPDKAIDILDEMEGQKVATMNAIIAVNYGQCLLLACHSAPSDSNREKLKAFVARGGQIIKADERQGTTLTEWKRIKNKAHQLLDDGSALCLYDVLTEWKTRNNSVMKSWANFGLGTRYLDKRHRRGSNGWHAALAREDV